MFTLHQTVISRSGRDSGSFLSVVATDERYVYVCDGKFRPLDNPKRKNPAHLTPLKTVLGDDAFRSDRALRKALARTKAEHNKE
ncbi:MAG: KOW domain-containing RNA-binding protein [Oscillospiraceae bacterium]|nr:KOW domain-containing RNA-binding protein [Oscillospiraceae bacterium]